MSDAIREIIEKNPLLKFGLSYGLFNLTRLSKFIIPQIEVRTKKNIKHSALTMNLSRLQKQMKKTAPKMENIKLENITVHSNLCTLTYFKSDKIHEKINKLHSRIRKENGYITITEGINEITLIIKADSQETAKKLIPEKPKNMQKDITSIGIKFPKEFNENPGLIYLILQQLALQYINIVEIASTYTELFVYISQKDTKLAFDTLHQSFQST